MNVPRSTPAALSVSDSGVSGGGGVWPCGVVTATTRSAVAVARPSLTVRRTV